MKLTPDTARDAEESPEPAPKARKLAGLWRRALNNPAPGGASCTQSPTVGRSLGSSAPGVAEEARRGGAPGSEAGAPCGPDPDQLTTVQRAVLAAARVDDQPDATPSRSAPDLPVETSLAGSDALIHAVAAAFVDDKVPALDVPPLPTHPQAQVIPKGKIRRFNGKRRGLRVGPVGFTEPEHAELMAAAERHGYEGTLSGYLADIALAFIRGAFTVDLPLHTDKQEVQEFRAKIRWEINRIGVNINQMVYVLHRDDRIEPDIRERLEHLDRLLTHIARALLIPTEPTDGESL